MGIGIGDITRGMTIIYNGDLYEVVMFEHVKRARGSAFVRAKLKSLSTGRTITETLKESSHLEAAFMETRPLQYLYSTGTAYVLMDKESFEEYHVSANELEDLKGYLLEGMDVLAQFHQGELLKIQPPSFVELKVAETPPGVKGDTATGGEKTATMETGLLIKVPLFIRAGDVLKVDTRTGAYVERVG